MNFHYFPPPHSGQTMTNMISEFLRECGLENKVFTMTVDKASSNDSNVKMLRQSLTRSGHLHLFQIFLVSYCAHLLDLVVQCGLEHVKTSFMALESPLNTSRVLQVGRLNLRLH